MKKNLNISYLNGAEGLHKRGGASSGGSSGGSATQKVNEDFIWFVDQMYWGVRCGVNINNGQVVYIISDFFDGGDTFKYDCTREEYLQYLKEKSYENPSGSCCYVAGVDFNTKRLYIANASNNTNYAGVVMIRYKTPIYSKTVDGVNDYYFDNLPDYYYEDCLRFNNAGEYYMADVLIRTGFCEINDKSYINNSQRFAWFENEKGELIFECYSVAG